MSLEQGQSFILVGVYRAAGIVIAITLFFYDSISLPLLLPWPAGFLIPGT